MNKRLVLQLLGKVLFLEGLLLLFPLLVSMIYGGEDALAFTAGVAAAAVLGALFSIIKVKDDTLRAREGLVTVALSWVAMSVVGALPLFLSGYMPNYIDCFFETVSGFTTTGSTLIRDVEALPHGLLFWRSMTQWVGGMGVLVLSLAVMPKMGGRAVNLLKAESPGPTPGKIVPRLGNTARILYKIYLALSALVVIVMLLCGMNLFDALIYAFGTAGTGGFSNYNDGINHFNSLPIDLWTGAFMLLFSLNFGFLYLLLRKSPRQALKSEELHHFLLIVGASTLVIALAILPTHEGIWDALRQSSFQVISIISTTGYATDSFYTWPQACRSVLLLLMLLGACSGSTSGGLKVSRFTLLLKSAWREIRRTVNPRSVHVVKMDGHSVEETVVAQVLVFAFLYVVIVLIGTLLVSFDNFDFETNFSAAVAATGNIGPGLSAIGPTGNYGGFSGFSKLVLAFLMLAGRLEIYPMLMLFSLGAWRGHRRA